MSKLNTYVHVHDKDGISHAFGPDDTVPEWAEKAITNPMCGLIAPAEGTAVRTRRTARMASDSGRNP
jgi:hypothetical protein